MTPNESARPLRHVTASTLRQIFNNNGHLEKFQSGGFIESTRSRPVNSALDFPLGTESVISHCRDKLSGDLVAVVHYYRLPDGALGASGLPDPKYLIHLGEHFAATDLPSG